MIIKRPNQQILDRFADELSEPRSSNVSKAFESLAHLINDTCPNSVIKVQALQKLLLARDNTLTAFLQKHDLVPINEYRTLQPRAPST